MTLKLDPFSQAMRGSIAVPGSKSITNRVLPLAALSGEKVRIFGALKSEDTDVMIQALKNLGVSVTAKYRQGANYEFVELQGEQGIFPHKGDITLDCKNSGTTLRFLTALCVLRDGNTTLTGNDRMTQRPIGDLGDALQELGIQVDYLEKQGFPPLRIQGNPNISANTIHISGATSSQFLSALLMLASCAPHTMHITVGKKLVSEPYVQMTVQILREFGVQVEINGNVYTVGTVRDLSLHFPKEYFVEADATSATYPLAIATITGGEITLENISQNSFQGDAQFAEIVLKKMGAKVEYSETSIRVSGPKSLHPLGDIDLASLPDAAMTAVILATYANGMSRITGLSTLKHKESDRLHALTKNLKKMGARVHSGVDFIEIEGYPEGLHGAEIETYDDHRVAMCFSVLGSVIPGVIIQNPECVQKTYPTYWEEYRSWGRGAKSTEQNPLPPSLFKLRRTSNPPYQGGRKKNIVLIGMRGSGKTTLGKALAEKYGYDFIDTDEEVERTAKKTISEIVEQRGWNAFRTLETEVCKDLSDIQNTVIATGGGVVLKPKNIEYLKKNGTIVFLNVPMEELVKRLQKSSHKRPALKVEMSLKEEMEEVWNERKDLYHKVADCVLQSDSFSNDSSVDVTENIEKLEEFLRKGFS